MSYGIYVIVQIFSKFSRERTDCEATQKTRPSALKSVDLWHKKGWFLIYIDDLAKVFKKSGIVVKFFADEVKFMNIQDCETVQKCLDLVFAFDARPQQLGLLKLRLRLDLLFCRRIVFALVSVKHEDFFEFVTVVTTIEVMHNINYSSQRTPVLFVTISLPNRTCYCCLE